MLFQILSITENKVLLFNAKLLLIPCNFWQSNQPQPVLPSYQDSGGSIPLNWDVGTHQEEGSPGKIQKNTPESLWKKEY